MNKSIMKILVTGSEGFIGKNLISHLKEDSRFKILSYSKEKKLDLLNKYIKDCDFIFHLAGVNRSKKLNQFNQVNFKLTNHICKQAKLSNKKIPILYTSTIQIKRKNNYGISKKKGEECLKKYSKDTKSKVYILRLPNIFGKWAKPNYNSVIATFCHNLANDKPIKIFNKDETLNLLYIDDLIKVFLNLLFAKKKNNIYVKLKNIKNIKIGKIEKYLREFIDSNYNLESGSGIKSFKRKLYSTFISYLPTRKFSYVLYENKDARGNFVEVTKNSAGQHSYFTAYPNIIRGGHYHHSKVEKFLILKGKAEFTFKNIISKKIYKICVNACENRIIFSIPGWAHTIKNIGKDEMIVFLWSCEVYSRKNPDTFTFNIY